MAFGSQAGIPADMRSATDTCCQNTRQRRFCRPYKCTLQIVPLVDAAAKALYPHHTMIPLPLSNAWVKLLRLDLDQGAKMKAASSFSDCVARPKMKKRRIHSPTIAIASTLVVLGATASLADPPAHIRNGKVLAEQLCANCHDISFRGNSPLETQPIGPDFAAMKALTAATLKERLRSSHPVMSKFPKLDDVQIGDLAAYVNSIRAQSKH